MPSNFSPARADPRDGKPPRYLYPVKSRHDPHIVYWYFRRGGTTTPLPGEYGSPEFWAAYAALLGGNEPPKGDDPFALLRDFKAIVVTAIQAEAPELAPVLAQRLLEATHERE